MYRAPTLEQIVSANKHSFDSSHEEVKKWIRLNDKTFNGALSKYHGYNRVVSLFEFDILSKLEGFIDIDRLCVVSGSEDEPEIKFLNPKEIFTTSLEDGYDLSEDWTSETPLHKKIQSNFNLVMCNQVLEHVPDPLSAFRNVVSLGVSGSYIWVSIPVINRIHSEPNFYSSGYHPRYLKFLADTTGLKTIHIGAWGSLKYKLFAVSRNWPPYRKLRRGLRSNSDFLFPFGMFVDGTKFNKKHLIDTWGLFYKP